MTVDTYVVNAFMLWDSVQVGCGVPCVGLHFRANNTGRAEMSFQVVQHSGDNLCEHARKLIGSYVHFTSTHRTS